VIEIWFTGADWLEHNLSILHHHHHRRLLRRRYVEPRQQVHLCPVKRDPLLHVSGSLGFGVAARSP
jgi:hypothetical protein